MGDALQLLMVDYGLKPPFAVGFWGNRIISSHPWIAFWKENIDRSFISKGIQFSLTQNKDFGWANLESKFGARFHQDHVERQHSPISYLMTDGNLVTDGISRPYKVWNKAESEALALYISETLSFKKLSIEAGVRFEDIKGNKKDFANNFKASIE